MNPASLKKRASACHRGSAAPQFPSNPAEDRELVDRCIGGDPEAWDALYRCFHHKLRSSIRALVPPGRDDPNLVDEVAARVWYAVVTNDGQLLARFDPARSARLSTFLATIARGQAVAIFRSEKRRRAREAIASRSHFEDREDPVDRDSPCLGDFLETLTAREREYCAGVLLDADEVSEEVFSSASAWKLRSRIHGKLRRFLSPGADAG